MRKRKILIVIMIFTLCMCVTGCSVSRAWDEIKAEIHSMVKGADFRQ